MSDLKFEDELNKPSVHPSVRNYGPDTVYDWDQEPWFRWVSESRAEQLGISVDQSRNFIKENRNPGGLPAEWARPREENVPYRKLVADAE